MSPRALAGVLAGLCAYNLVLAVFMFAIGAFPVPIFLGLDVAGVLIAFRVSNQGGRRERVRVTPEEVRVTSDRRGAEKTLWTSPTAFTRLEVDRVEEGVAALRVRLSHRTLRIGSMLGPGELAVFSERLALALGAARAARHA
jgi:uncharacterized membrane protein